MFPNSNMNEYINMIKNRKLDNIKVATANSSELKKLQDNKCVKCKKELRAGYYKSVINPETKKRELICSNCLVDIHK